MPSPQHADSIESFIGTPRWVREKPEPTVWTLSRSELSAAKYRKLIAEGMSVERAKWEAYPHFRKTEERPD